MNDITEKTREPDERPHDFSALPVVSDDVFTAPLKRPAHVGEDWLEPQQTQYDSEDDKIWDELIEREMTRLSWSAPMNRTGGSARRRGT